MRRISQIALGVVVLIGLALPAAADPTCLDTTLIAEGPFSGYDPSPLCEGGICPGSDLVIESDRSWQRLWDRFSSDPLPAVNFREQIVIATFMGKRPNTSYTTDIDCISETGFVPATRVIPLNVDIVDSNAGTGCIVSPAVVNPFQIVVLDRPTNGLGQPLRVHVSFNHTANVSVCDPDDPICVVCNGNGGNGDIEPDGLPCCP